jgi:hypothetical protein
VRKSYGPDPEIAAAGLTAALQYAVKTMRNEVVWDISMTLASGNTFRLGAGQGIGSERLDGPVQLEGPERAIDKEREAAPVELSPCPSFLEQWCGRLTKEPDRPTGRQSRVLEGCFESVSADEESLAEGRSPPAFGALVEESKCFPTRIDVLPTQKVHEPERPP